MPEVLLTRDIYQDGGRWAKGTVVGQIDASSGRVTAAPGVSPFALTDWIAKSATDAVPDSVSVVVGDAGFEEPSAQICRKIREANELVLEDQKAVVERE